MKRNTRTRGRLSWLWSPKDLMQILGVLISCKICTPQFVLL